MKRSRDEHYESLQQWRATELKELFRLNPIKKCKTPNEIECMAHQLQQEIHRVDELYATEHGTVLVFGDNDNQLLGLPWDETADTTTPTPLANVDEVRSVSVGGMHSTALTVHGQVYTWGVADNGALAYTAPAVEGMPQTAPQLSHILQVKAGDSQTLFLNTDGQVFMCGMVRASNDKQFHYPVKGESCKGCIATPVPIPMPGNKKAVRIETGNASNFAAAVLEDGSIVTFGFGEMGELARTKDIIAPQLDGKLDVSKALKTMKQADIVRKFLTPEVLSLACGSNHLLVVARNRGEGIASLYSSGQNSSGQLGLPEEVDAVHELTHVRDHVGLIAAGPYHSYVVDGDGHLVFSCGQNSYAQLGIGRSSTAEFGLQPVAFPEPVLITRIASGGSHGMALDSNNNFYTWGFGTMGATGHHRDANGEAGGDVFRPTKLDLNSNKKVLDFGGGGQHSVVLLSENDFEE